LKENVTKLKKILEREYTTFFNPMYTNYYANDVTFTDPMTTLSGVQSYQNNVDMLASRTFLGKFLFTDASISLHSVTGGDIDTSSSTSSSSSSSSSSSMIQDIVTRWTLRLTVSILPWKPTARFTGISIYKVKPTTNDDIGVSITGQIDYWDSVNIKPNSSGEYMSVDKSVAINDFLEQLKPGGFQAQGAAPEVPYQLLRRGDGYEGEFNTSSVSSSSTSSSSSSISSSSISSSGISSSSIISSSTSSSSTSSSGGGGDKEIIVHLLPSHKFYPTFSRFTQIYILLFSYHLKMRFK
jgi:hypothetical protein